MSNFLPVNQLDFNTLRSNLKTFLQNQDRFKDYDFEGSNISVLLDLLAYNTYQNAFYLNMVGSEMFLDTATLRDSIISHAKELNYLPRSYTSATATLQVKINVTNNAIGVITIPQGYRFSSTTTTNTFSFTTDSSYVVARNSNNEFVATVDIKEGFNVSENFIVNNNITDQRFVITNDRVDTDSIRVFVATSTVSNDNVEYTHTTNTVGLNNLSNVFFKQAAENNRYEVIFGDGIIGRKLITGNLVTVNYRIASGSVVNGINQFTPQSNIDGYSVNVLSVLYPASGGAERETNSSIKYNATKYFQTQDRAVTKNDYKSLIIANFPEIRTVNVFGGEEIPLVPQYGRVFISAITQTGEEPTLSTANRVLTFIKERSPLSINPSIINSEFLSIIVTSKVTYNATSTTLTDNQIKTLVLNSISNFNTVNLLDYGKTFRYSKLTSTIDNTHASIISNETSLLISKTVIPTLNSKYSTTIDFNNPFERDDNLTPRPTTNDFTVFSSQFTYNTKPAYFGEDGAGNLFIYENTSTGRNILKLNAGVVDYNLGLVNITDLFVSNFTGTGITLFIKPKNQDIFSQRNTILQINNNLTEITLYPVKE